MLEPVAPISSWHQVILALSVLTSPSWNLCSNSANQSDSTCCLFVVLSHVVNNGVHRGCLLYDFDSKFFFRTAFYFLLFRTTIFLFFYLCLIPYVYSNQQFTAFATICY